MYVQGAVLSVPADRKEDYVNLAKHMGQIMLDHGAVEVIENWEVDVPDGEHTDFRRAVKAERNGKIVFSWVIWPSKEFHEKIEEEMLQDKRMERLSGDMPFEGKHMIFGGFETIYSGRSGD